jgi:hypothetical protein
MSQQHAQYEEEFRDGPMPEVPYQAGYTGPHPVSYTVNVPPLPSYMSMPAQKLVAPGPRSEGKAGVVARLLLAIVSIIFVFIMFLIAIALHGRDGFASNDPVVYLFALIFAVVVVSINFIFNRRR